ncbi:Phenylacetic acid catabolic protein [Xanthobacter sp. V4C-4]|uniref:Phenylacetic acid catabolic protein n=1 Tax=Xanthobacter cornucopiae TaxID=3119924 RepID=UPI003726F750
MATGVHAPVHRPEQATGEYRDLLIRLLTRQLLAESATLEVFGRAIDLAPTFEEKLLSARFAWEEGEHTRVILGVLAELGVDGRALIAQRPSAEEFWGIKLDSWVALAAFNFLVDRGGSHQIEEYLHSTYRPWARHLYRMLGEEAAHYEHGIENIQDFAAAGDGLATFQAVIDQLLPVLVKRAFGRPDSAENAKAVEFGLKRSSSDVIVNAYLAEIREPLGAAGLRFPPLAAFDAAGVQLLPSTHDVILTLQ